MFLTWNQIILVQDQAKRRPNDAVVYIHQDSREQTLWPAFDKTAQADYEQHGLLRYGTIYQDAAERWCVIPNAWNENDADRAKFWI